MINRQFFPLLGTVGLLEVFSEIRHVFDSDKVRRNSDDDYGLGPGFYHLTVPAAAAELGLVPGRHGKHGWETNYVKVRPDVYYQIGTRLMMPPSGFELIQWPDGDWRLFANGAHHIGSCQIARIRRQS